MAIKIGVEADISGAKAPLNDLMTVLMKTGQAGKGLSDIKINPKQFTEAASELKYFRREFESWKKTAEGGIAFSRAEKFGQPVDAPWKWNWNAMYASQRQAQQARDRFWFRTTGQEVAMPQRQAPAPAARYPVAPAAAGWLAGSAQRWSQGWHRVAGGRSIAGIITGGLGAAAGLAGAAAGSVAGPVGAILGTLGAGLLAKRGVEIGYAEHKAALPAFDEVYRKMADATPWDELTDAIRELGGQLHMTSSEAAGLAHMFQSVSGSADAGAIERAAFAGRFGRGVGMSKMESAHGFAAAEYLGIGGSRSEQREFAALLAETISGGGMYARSTQVMENLLGYIKTAESRTARVTPVEELQRYAAYRAETYQNPALRGQVGDSLLQKAGGLLRGGGPVKEMFMWRTFGNEIKGNPFAMEFLKNANPLQTVFEATGGIGSKDKALLEFTADMARRDAETAFGKAGSKEERDRRTAVYVSHMSGMTPQQALALVDVMERVGENFGQFSAWMKEQGIDMAGIKDPAAIGALSRLYRGEDPIAIARQYIAEGSGIKEEDRKEVEKYIGDIDELRRRLPKIIERNVMPRTPTERDEKVSADFKIALEKYVGTPVGRLTREIKEGLMSGAEKMGQFITSFESKADKFIRLYGHKMNEEKISSEEYKGLVKSELSTIKKALGVMPDEEKATKNKTSEKRKQMNPDIGPGKRKSIMPDLGFKPNLSGLTKQKASTVFDFFVHRGLQPHQSAAIAGNLIQESGLDPNAVGDNGKSIGLAQWQGERQPPKDNRRFNDQLKHIWTEFHSTERKAFNALLAADDLKEATRVFSRLYERAGKPMIGRRIAYAREVLKDNTDKSNIPAMPINQGHQKTRMLIKPQNEGGTIKLPPMETFFPLPDFAPPKIPQDAEAAVRYNTIPPIADARLGGQIDVNVQQVDHLGRRVRQLTRQSFRPEPKLVGTVDVGVLSGSHYRPAILGID